MYIAVQGFGLSDCSKRGLAEGTGFEPAIGCYPYNGLANRRLLANLHAKSRRNRPTAGTSARRKVRETREQQRSAQARESAQRPLAALRHLGTEPERRVG